MFLRDSYHRLVTLLPGATIRGAMPVRIRLHEDAISGKEMDPAEGDIT